MDNTSEPSWCFGFSLSLVSKFLSLKGFGFDTSASVYHLFIWKCIIAFWVLEKYSCWGFGLSFLRGNCKLQRRNTIHLSHRMTHEKVKERDLFHNTNTFKFFNHIISVAYVLSRKVKVALPWISLHLWSIYL